MNSSTSADLRRAEPVEDGAAGCDSPLALASDPDAALGCGLWPNMESQSSSHWF